MRPRVATAGASSARSQPKPSRKVTATALAKPGPEPVRDAKDTVGDRSGLDEESEPADFSGVDTAPPVEDGPGPQREVAVKGIEGTMSEFDVRTTLENRDEDFDRCHDRHRGGSGRIEFRIHVLANGDVGDVKVHRSKVRNSALVDCYTEVVASSHFTLPHGGYADVKWTTKVGRSRTRHPDILERRVRWDAPSGSTQVQEPERAEGHRERHRSHRSRRSHRSHGHHHRQRSGA